MLQAHLDTFIHYGTIAAIFYFLLYTMTDSFSPIVHLKTLFENLGVARGAVTVTLAIVLIVMLTSKANAEMSFSAIVGIDTPLNGKKSLQCEPGSKNEIGSNINLRAGIKKTLFEFGAAFNHQSGAVCEDDITIDAYGPYVKMDYGRIEITIDAQVDKDDTNARRYALTGDYVIYELDQYKLSLFLQKQWDEWEEETAGINVSWSF